MLEKRIAHLEKRIFEAHEHRVSLSYDIAELGALRWALRIVRQWCTGFNQRLISRIEVLGTKDKKS